MSKFAGLHEYFIKLEIKLEADKVTMTFSKIEEIIEKSYLLLLIPILLTGMIPKHICYQNVGLVTGIKWFTSI